MPKDDANIQRIDEAFQQARRELDRVGSMRPQIDRRIAGATMKPAVSSLGWTVGAAVMILIAGAVLWWRFASPPPTRQVVIEAERTIPSNFTLQIGDAEFAEHLAAIVDRGAVIVIWSYRGEQVVPESAERRSGKYLASTYRQYRLDNGRMLVCSIFVPDAGVFPALDPPAIRARSGESQVAFNASPRRVSDEELFAAVRRCGTGDVLDILRQARHLAH